MYGGGTGTGTKGVQSVVVAGRGGYVVDVDVGTGCGTNVGGVGYGWDGDGDRPSRWEDNVAHVTVGTEPNNPLAYAPGLQYHHPIRSSPGGPGGQLEI